MAHKSYTSKGNKSPFVFELDGVEFRTDGGLQLLDLLDIAKMAHMEAISPEGLAAIAGLFSAALGQAEYERLRAHMRAHNTDPETLLDIMGDMLDHLTRGFPTQPPNGSAFGRSKTGGMSSVDLPATSTPPAPQLTPDAIAAYHQTVRAAEATAETEGISFAEAMQRMEMRAAVRQRMTDEAQDRSTG